MTRQEVPPLLSLSGAVLEAQWDGVGHITLSDRCRRPVGREKKEKTAMSHFWDTHHRAHGSGVVKLFLFLDRRPSFLTQGDVSSRLLCENPVVRDKNFWLVRSLALVSTGLSTAL